MLPVVMVTALDPAEERIKGLEAGADDFLTKPINQPELLARVRSLLRIKHSTTRRAQARSSRTEPDLERRVQEQVAAARAAQPAEALFLAAARRDHRRRRRRDPLKSHRREITVVFLDLRGFTAFAETAEPEEVMGVLREFHAAIGKLILAHEGTLERFTGDGMMIFFNDPVPVPDPAERAVRMALAMRDRVGGADGEVAQARPRARASASASRRATPRIGAIGFEGR